MWRWHSTYCGKAFEEGYNFASDLTLIKGLHTKLLASKGVGVPILGVSRQNDIWVLALWPCTNNTIRGRWWLPPSPGRGESCEFVFALCSSMHQKCYSYALTNLLFGCTSLCEWMNHLSLVLVPSQSSNMLLYPQSVANQGAHPNSFFVCCFHF